MGGDCIRTAETLVDDLTILPDGHIMTRLSEIQFLIEQEERYLDYLRTKRTNYLLELQRRDFNDNVNTNI